MSDRDNKILLGKILGEIYHFQKESGVNRKVDDGRVFGLLNGIEACINDELAEIGWVSQEECDKIMGVLNRIYSDKERMESITGYYDIEEEFNELGIKRWQVVRVMKYCQAEGKYFKLLKKMDTQNSPEECREFLVYEFET